MPKVKDSLPAVLPAIDLSTFSYGSPTISLRLQRTRAAFIRSPGGADISGVSGSVTARGVGLAGSRRHRGFSN
jgi:hypothetical protein